MLGYSRADIVGRNINVIMPPPYAANHHAFLTRFLETGESYVLNRSRVMFALHRSGWLLPVETYVRQFALERLVFSPCFERFVGSFFFAC